MERIYDVGVAGIHRLLAHRKTIANSRVVIVCAGMEGALPSVVGGMVGVPVIAVPTSVGYGAAFQGMAALLGMLTGIGGGMMRDVLLTEIPQVLRSDLYAVAALAGASIVAIGDVLGLPYGVSALAGGILCFGLRFMAIRHGWRLPVAHLSARRRAGTDSSDDR